MGKLAHECDDQAIGAVIDILQLLNVKLLKGPPKLFTRDLYVGHSPSPGSRPAFFNSASMSACVIGFSRVATGAGMDGARAHGGKFPRDQSYTIRSSQVDRANSSRKDWHSAG